MKTELWLMPITVHTAMSKPSATDFLEVVERRVAELRRMTSAEIDKAVLHGPTDRLEASRCSKSHRSGWTSR